MTPHWRQSVSRVTLAMLATCFVSSHEYRTATAQVVQLPAVHTFGTTGTVSVPDRGAALLGGNGYARSGATQSGWGPMASRASGSQVGGGTMSVHATIIDLDAMDKAILNAAASRPTPSTSSAPSSTKSATGATATTDAPAASAQTLASSRSIPSNFRSNKYGTAITNTLNPTRYSQQVLPRSPRPANDWQLAMAGASHIAADDPTPGVAHDEDGEVRHYMQRAADAQNSGRMAAANVYYRLAYDHMSTQQQERFNALVEQRKAAAVLARKAQAGGAAANEKAASAAASTSPSSTSEPAAEASASPFDMPAAAAPAAPADAGASPF